MFKRSISLVTLALASVGARAGTLVSFRIEPAIESVTIQTEDNRVLDKESGRISLDQLDGATILRLHLIDGRFTIQARDAARDLSQFTVIAFEGELRIGRVGSRSTGRTLELLHAEDAPENTLFRTQPLGADVEIAEHLRVDAPAGYVEVKPMVLHWALENSKTELWVTFPAWDHGVMVRVRADPDRYVDHWRLTTRDGASYALRPAEMIVKVPLAALDEIRGYPDCDNILSEDQH